MKTYSFSTIALLIINGLSVSAESQAKFSQADTPNLDKYAQNFPATCLYSSGSSVALNNSKKLDTNTGHIVLGSGRRHQPIGQKISQDITLDEFYDGSKLDQIKKDLAEDNRLNLIGTLDPQGNFSKFEHLKAVIDYAAKAEIPTSLHLILETENNTNLELRQLLVKLEDKIEEYDFIEIATLSSREFGLSQFDWKKKKQLYNFMLGKKENIKEFGKASEVVSDKTNKLKLTARKDANFIENSDAILFFNYTQKYLLDLMKVFTLPVFEKFERDYLDDSETYSLVDYQQNLPIESIYSQPILHNTLAETLDRANITQAYLTPTEKYAQLNYYFKGARREKLESEERFCLSSKPKTYKNNPTKGVDKTYKKLTQLLQQDKFKFIAAEFPNFELAPEDKKIQALEYIDTKVGKIVDNLLVKNGACLITSEYSLEDNGRVPLYLLANQYKQLSFPGGDTPMGKINLASSSGSVADIAPTILHLMKIERPEEMSGSSLLRA